jgi:hypothetical protein
MSLHFDCASPTRGVTFLESDSTIALGPRHGDIARPRRLDIVEDFALVIDFVVCARVIFQGVLSNIRYVLGRLLLLRRDIIGDSSGRLCIIAAGQYGDSENAERRYNLNIHVYIGGVWPAE